jgi:hypothetical protein
LSGGGYEFSTEVFVIDHRPDRRYVSVWIHDDTWGVSATDTNRVVLVVVVMPKKAALEAAWFKSQKTLVSFFFKDHQHSLTVFVLVVDPQGQVFPLAQANSLFLVRFLRYRSQQAGIKDRQ